jgi:magnesium chelatase subunit I
MIGYDPVRHPGNQALFRALDLSILSTLVGLPLHVHAEGLRGTGKTTIMRSVRRRLPRIQRIKGCVYNCAPWAPHCPEHRNLSSEEVSLLAAEWVPMPFREISHSAKVGTVAGSIDLARITARECPGAALLPGTLPQAHRGVIFIDEINRLADTAPELADILLDVMGTKPGRLQIEETGLPGVDLPISVSVWAASNPDEDPGPLEDIRKQLSDRFDFVIAMERPGGVAAVREILRSSRKRQMVLSGVPVLVAGDVSERPEEEDGPAGAGGERRGEEAAEEAADWERLVGIVRQVECPLAVEDVVASIYVDFGLESLRGVEAIHHGARMNCVLEGREKMTLVDVAAVAPGALHHRLDISTFARVMDYLAERAGIRSGLSDTDPEQAATASSGLAAVAAPGGGPFPGSSADLGPSGQEPAASPAGEAASRGLASGWLSWSSIFGRRARQVDAAGRRPGSALPGRAGSAGEARPGNPSGGDPDQTGRGWGRSGQGGRGEPGETTSPGTDHPVAPLHAARPLAQILRDMELGAFEPRGPRLP